MIDKQLKQDLKAKAHHIKPVVQLGAKGLTSAVIDEIEVALNAHELIKIKIPSVEKQQRQALAQEICKQTNAFFIQSMGNILTVYRQKPEED